MWGIHYLSVMLANLSENSMFRNKVELGFEMASRQRKEEKVDSTKISKLIICARNHSIVMVITPIPGLWVRSGTGFDFFLRDTQKNVVCC